MDIVDENEPFKLTLEQLISVFLYSYGGHNSKVYDLPLSIVAADILSYRLRGAIERPDLFLLLKESLSAYWRHERHPEKWTGKGFKKDA